MATRQGFKLPDNFESVVRPWIAARSGAKDWGNARSIRTLLEKSREAQAVRISRGPNADLSRLDIEDLTRATGG